MYIRHQYIRERQGGALGEQLERERGVAGQLHEVVAVHGAAEAVPLRHEALVRHAARHRDVGVQVPVSAGGGHERRKCISNSTSIYAFQQALKHTIRCMSLQEYKCARALVCLLQAGITLCPRKALSHGHSGGHDLEEWQTPHRHDVGVTCEVDSISQKYMTCHCEHWTGKTPSTRTRRGTAPGSPRPRGDAAQP